MAWIESHQALRDHKKIGRLCRALDIRRREAWGIVHGLWWWSLDNAKGGLLTDADPKDIAEACDWGGPGETPERLIDGLVEAGFLDRKPCRKRSGKAVENGRTNLVLHDWPEYAGRLLAQRSRISRGKRDWLNTHRKNGKVNDPDDGNRTTPDRTTPDQPNSSRSRERPPVQTGSPTGTGLRDMPRLPSRTELDRKRREFQRLGRMP